MRKIESQVLEEYGPLGLKEFCDARNRSFFLLKDLHANGVLKDAASEPKMTGAGKLQSGVMFVMLAAMVGVYVFGGVAQIPLMILFASIFLFFAIDNAKTSAAVAIMKYNSEVAYSIKESDIVRELGYYGISASYPSADLNILYEEFLKDNDFKYFETPEKVKTIVESLENNIYINYMGRSTLGLTKGNKPKLDDLLTASKS
jgi:hypothetical protein